MAIPLIDPSRIPAAAALDFALLAEEALLLVNLQLLAVREDSLATDVAGLAGYLEGCSQDAHQILGQGLKLGICAVAFWAIGRLEVRSFLLKVDIRKAELAEVGFATLARERLPQKVTA